MQKPRANKTLVAMFAVLFSAFLLVGCGGKDAKTSSQKQTESSAASGSSSATEKSSSESSSASSSKKKDSSKGGSGQESSKASSSKVNASPKSFPSFSTTDIYEESYDASVFADKDVTVVYLWQTSSADVEEMARLSKWSGEMSSKAQVLGIVVDCEKTEGDEYGAAANAINESGATFTQLLFCDDFKKLLSENGISSYPCVLLVDSEGKIVEGPIVGESFEEYIKAMEEYLADKYSGS